jgi:hypothetical protein
MDTETKECHQANPKEDILLPKCSVVWALGALFLLLFLAYLIKTRFSKLL